MNNKFPIGVFDSGYGGLTVLREFTSLLPSYDFIYLGDNARAPYGSRSYETVFEYTWQSVQQLFNMGCPLVILACNTASAKALRTIQQRELPNLRDEKKVLGVIRPTAEIVGNYSKSKHVGVLGTAGTIKSNSYLLEILKFFPDIIVSQEACPLWVPLIENNEQDNTGADFFIQKNLKNLLNKDSLIDTIILGCTHYPIISDKIKKFLPKGISVLSQGNIVAESLRDYLHRHPEIESRLSKGGSREFFTTDKEMNFDSAASFFYGEKIKSKHISF